MNRKMMFRKRKATVINKATELSDLCKIDVCLIIYPEADQTTAGRRRPIQPETWPEDREKFNEILNRYKASKDIPSPGLKREFRSSDFPYEPTSHKNKKQKLQKEVVDRVDVEDGVDANEIQKWEHGLKREFRSTSDFPYEPTSQQNKKQEFQKEVVDRVDVEDYVDTNEIQRWENKYPSWDDRLEEFSEEELIQLIASIDSKIQESTRMIDSVENSAAARVPMLPSAWMKLETL